MEGGEGTAKQLRQGILDELENKKDFKSHQQIVTRVYANLRALVKAYTSSNIVTTSGTVSQLVLGFTKANPFCDFIDAGDHKEAVIEKIEGTLSMSFNTTA